MEKLAQLFFKNWLKETGINTIELDGSPEFTKELERLGCNSQRLPLSGFMGGQIDVADAITCLTGFDKFDELLAGSFLRYAKTSIAPGGVVFLRVDNSIWGLDRFLELLWDNPYFKVAETYEVGTQRDYLLRPIEHRPTICIGMIAKNEERDLPRCLKSLEGVADGLVLLDTGSKDKTKDIARQWADNQSKNYLNFHKQVRDYHEASEKDETGDWKLWNFGKARNEYVRLIEEAGYDYVLWMDADDELVDKKIKNLVFLDQYVIHGVQIESGGIRWPHHRMWKAGKGIRYSGWCHEYPAWSGKDCIHQDITVKHDAAPGDHENSNDRNLRILKRAMETEPTPRNAFYLANTYKDRKIYPEAVEAYQKRMDFGYGYEDEYWFAVLYKARCERAAGKVDDARRTLTYAMSRRADWAEFPMELAYLENAAGNYFKAIGWSMLAKDSPVVPTQLWREKDKYIDQPYRTISWAYQHMGDFAQAIDWAEQAREKIGGPDISWEVRINQLRDMSGRTKKTVTKKSVVWHRPGALGDVLMTLSLIPAFKEKFPEREIVYKTHPYTIAALKDLMLTAGVDRVVSTEEPNEDAPHYNLVGYPLREGYPEKPMRQHLLKYFSEELGLGGVTSHLKLPLPKRLVHGGLPHMNYDYICMHVKAGWSPYKNWGFDKWEKLVHLLHGRGFRVAQIGGEEDPLIPGAENYMDLPFMESLGVLANAKLHMGIDSWSNHATNIEWEGKGKTPGVILWGSTQPSAAGYEHNTNISLGLPCSPCFREDPKISKMSRGVCPNPGGQVFEDPKHACMAGITVDMVFQKVISLWNAK